jgi:hypothetical protein
MCGKNITHQQKSTLPTARQSATEIIEMKVHAKKAFVPVCGAAAAILIAGTMSVIVSQPASAKPEFAAQTGKPCGECHQSPAGGGALKPFGEKFKANGFKLPK